MQTGWHDETGNFPLSLAKVKKMNLQVLVAKKNKLHDIHCPETKRIHF